ncbi:MAG: Permease of the drug/metabolite transporter superfamily [Armatimonadetes bacterium]|nr:Permease of the drug/metabolite transporter superfamily [Armatimonadota bacterium]
MRDSARLTRSDVALLLAANLLWGSTYVVARGLLDVAPPLVVGFLRYAAATLCLLAISAHRGPRGGSTPPVTPAERRSDFVALLVTGVVGFGLGKVLVYEGLARSTATDAALIINLEALFTAVFGFLILRQRLGRVTCVGLLVAFGGGAMLLWPDDSNGPATARTFGNALMIGSVAAEALASVLGAGATRRYSGLQVTAYATYWGTLTLAGPAWWQWRAAQWDLSWLTAGNVVALLYLAVGATILAYAFWYRVLERVDAGRVAAFLYAQPLLGVILGIGLRGERPTTAAAIGGALVLAGLWLTNRPEPASDPES